MKVTLQTHAPKKFHLCDGGDKRPHPMWADREQGPHQGVQIKKIYQRKLINIFSSYEITKENKIRRILVP